MGYCLESIVKAVGAVLHSAGCWVAARRKKTTRQPGIPLFSTEDTGVTETRRSSLMVAGGVGGAHAHEAGHEGGHVELAGYGFQGAQGEGLVGEGGDVPIT